MRQVIGYTFVLVGIAFAASLSIQLAVALTAAMIGIHIVMLDLALDLIDLEDKRVDVDKDHLALTESIIDSNQSIIRRVKTLADNQRIIAQTIKAELGGDNAETSDS